MDAYNYAAQSGQMYSGTARGNFGGGFLEGVGTGVANWATGDIDYARDLEKLGFENAFNASQAQLNREWQQRMRDSSIESEFNQLRAQGINPYAAQGYSVGSPSGSTAFSGSGGAPQSRGRAVNDILRLVSSVLATSFNAFSNATRNNLAAERIALARDTAFAARASKEKNYSFPQHSFSKDELYKLFSDFDN